MIGLLTKGTFLQMCFLIVNKCHLGNDNSEILEIMVSLRTDSIVFVHKSFIYFV